MIANPTSESEKCDLSIVIPCYFSEKNLPALHKALESTIHKMKIDYEILLIDDASKDNTFELIRKIHANNPRVKAVRMQRNFGQHMAISVGFLYAKGEIVMTMDDDLQDDPSNIPVLYNAMKNGTMDIVSGVRRKRHDPMRRKIGSWVMNKVFSTLVGVKLNDYGCMMNAYRNHAAKSLSEYGGRHKWIPSLMAWLGFKIVEVEVTHNPRYQGKSGYSLKRLIRLSFDVITSVSDVPFYIIDFCGICVSLLGFGVAVYLGILRFVYDIRIQGILLLFALTLAILGVIVLMLGLLGEFIIRTYREVSGRPMFLIKETLV